MVPECVDWGQGPLGTRSRTASTRFGSSTLRNGGTMASLSAEKIAQAAFDLKLIDDRQLQDVWASLGSRNVSAEDFSEALLRRELLTGYQLDRLLRGEKAGFFFGSYKILYLVGRASKDIEHQYMIRCSSWNQLLVFQYFSNMQPRRRMLSDG